MERAHYSKWTGMDGLQWRGASSQTIALRPGCNDGAAEEGIGQLRGGEAMMAQSGYVGGEKGGMRTKNATVARPLQLYTHAGTHAQTHTYTVCMVLFNLATRLLLPERHMGSMWAGQWPLYLGLSPKDR